MEISKDELYFIGFLVLVELGVIYVFMGTGAEWIGAFGLVLIALFTIYQTWRQR